VIGRKGLDLADVMAHQAVLSPFQGVRDVWCLTSFPTRFVHTLSNLVAGQACVVGPALVVGRKGLDLADVMARQAVLPALEGMGNGSYLASFATRLALSFGDLVTGQASVVGPALVVGRKGLDLADVMAH
jgi:hypothetical protein